MANPWDKDVIPSTTGSGSAAAVATPNPWDKDIIQSANSTPASLSDRLPKELGHIYAPPLRESGFLSENGFGPGTFGKGIGEVIQPGNRQVGLHHMLMGAGEMASPLIIPALSAAPAATITGLAGTALAGGVGKIGSSMAGASPETSDLIGDAAGLAGGYGGSRLGDAVHRIAVSPKFQSAAMEFSPYKKFMNLGTAALDAVRGSPESIAARTMPPVGPRETATLPSGRLAPILPFQSRESFPPPSGPGSKLGQNPFAEPLDLAQLISGRQRGGLHNAELMPPPIAPNREAPLWQQYDVQPHATPVPEFSSIPSDLPSGRYPVSSRSFVDPRELSVIAPEPVEVSPGKDTPATVRDRAKTSRAKFDENGKRNQLKK